MIGVVRKLLRTTNGGTLVEYALLLSLICGVAFVGLKLLGQNTSGALNTAACQMDPGHGGGDDGGCGGGGGRGRGDH